MNIDVYCLCWNEIKVLPFVIQYWKRFARHVYVYDNGSDDGSLELLAQYPDWITVIHYETNNTLNDIAYLQIKNNCWKVSDADWVCVCDMDECLYAKDIFGEIEKLEKEGVNVISPQWCDVWGDKFPEYDETKLCHEVIGGVNPSMQSHLHKCILFKPCDIKEINYGIGAHTCHPVGDNPKIDFLKDKLWLVHLKNLSADYRIERFKACAERLSDVNKKHGFGFHYNMKAEETRKEFEEGVKLPKIMI